MGLIRPAARNFSNSLLFSLLAGRCGDNETRACAVGRVQSACDVAERSQVSPIGSLGAPQRILAEHKFTKRTNLAFANEINATQAPARPAIGTFRTLPAPPSGGASGRARRPISAPESPAVRINCRQSRTRTPPLEAREAGEAGQDCAGAIMGAPVPHRARAALDTLSASFLYPARIGEAVSKPGCERPAAGALRFVLFHQRGGGKPAGGRAWCVAKSALGREADGGGVAQLVRAAES